MSEQLDPLEEADLASHIEQCEYCHQEPEKLTCSPGLGRTDAGMAGPATIDTDSTARRGWVIHREPPPRPGAIAQRGLPAIPGYDLLEKTGEGGMGVVYLARRLGLNRQVAVKMIRGGTQAGPDHFARFRIEAEAVVRLRHSNIIQIHEIGEFDGQPFVSLELLEGGSLADRLECTPHSARQTAELMLTLASAVQVAHDVEIVHRDLKPSNVLFTEDGTPLITDFGLSTESTETTERIPRRPETYVALAPESLDTLGQLPDVGIDQEIPRAAEKKRTGIATHLAEDPYGQRLSSPKQPSRHAVRPVPGTSVQWARPCGRGWMLRSSESWSDDQAHLP